jgi:uncharacterized protein (DUF1697 family)
MDRLVAFLRGMNLGGRRITNDELAGHFADAGLVEPTPYQASGNVVFTLPGDLNGDPAALERRIEDHLQRALGYPVDTFVRSLAELAAIIAADGLEAAEADGFKVHVILLHDPPPRDVLDRLARLETDDDRFLPRPGAATAGAAPSPEIFWLRRGRLSDSAIDASDPGALTGGRTSTMRTIGTLRRIVKKFG